LSAFLAVKFPNAWDCGNCEKAVAAVAC